LISRQRKHYHNSVDTLSIGAWWKAQEEIDLKWLHKNLTGISDQTPKSLQIWEKIEDSYIQLIGLGDTMKDLIELKLKFHKACCDFIEGNQFADNWVRIYGNAIIAMETEIKNRKGLTNERKLAILRKGSSYRINRFKMTVREFHEDHDLLVEEAKERNRIAA